MKIITLFIPVVIIFCNSDINAANLFWIGNGANWSNPSNWSYSSGGAACNCIPTQADDVFFDENSFSLSDQIISIDNASYCRTMDWSEVTNSPTLSGSSNLTIFGSLILSGAMVNSYTGNIYFKSTGAANNIMTNGEALSSHLYFDGINGEWNLNGDLSNPDKQIRLTAGTINTNNYSMTIRNFVSTGDTIKSLYLGSSGVNLGGSSLSVTAWLVTASNLIINAGTSSINLTSNSSTFHTDNRTYYDVNFTGLTHGQLNANNSSFHNLSFQGAGTIHSGSTFNEIVFYDDAFILSSCIFNNIVFAAGKTASITGIQTVSGSITSPASCGLPANIFGGTFNKTSGSVILDFVRLQNVTATGGALFTANNCTDLGGNNGWIITPPIPQNLFWIGNSGNWSDQNHWSFTSGGVSSNCIPTPYDNVFFNGSSFGSPGQTVTIDKVAYCKSMDWTGANAPVFTGNQIMNVFGSLILNPTMTFSASAPIYFKSTNPGNHITTHGKAFSNSLTFEGIGGEWLLQDDLTTSDDIWFEVGAFITNNNTINANRFISDGNGMRFLSIGNSVINISGAGGCNICHNPWNVGGSNLTFSSGASVINLSGLAAWFFSYSFNYFDVNFTNTNDGTAVLYASNSSFHDVNFSSNAWIYSFAPNSFNDVSILGVGESNFTGSQSFNNLTLGPSSKNLITGTLTLGGNLFLNGTCLVPAHIIGGTINKSIGSILLSYVRLENSNATGGANFTANNSTDLGGNNGWIINTPPGQSLYWVGDGGNWTDANHWSLSSGGSSANCIPSPYDDVYFDANSFPNDSQVVVINQYAYCKTMDWTGVLNMPTLSIGNSMSVYGSLILSPVMVFVGGLFQSINFRSNSTGNEIITSGLPIPCGISFNNEEGGWTLMDDLVVQYIISHSAGNFSTNDNEVSTQTFYVGGGGVCTLTLGSSVINLSAFTAWVATDINCTILPGTSIINVNSGSVVFIAGSLSYNDVNFNGLFNASIQNSTGVFHNVSFASNASISGNNTFNVLSLAVSKVTTLAGTQTILEDMICNGTCVNSATLTGGGIYKESGEININYVTVENVSASGGADFYANNSISSGNNPGWQFVFSAPQNLYWIGNSGNWNDPDHWSLSSGGISSGCLPTANDDVYFDGNSFTIPAQSVVIDQIVACRNFTWNGPLIGSSLSGAMDPELNIHGSLLINSTFNSLYTGKIYFKSTNTGNTITTTGNTINSPIYFAGSNGEWSLQDNFNSTSHLYLVTGTFNTNNKTVNASSIQSTGDLPRAILLGSSTLNLFNSLPCSIGSNTPAWYITGLNFTLNSGTSIINCTGESPFFFAPSGTYYDLNFTNTNGCVSNLQINSGSANFHNVFLGSETSIFGEVNYNNLTLGEGSVTHLYGNHTISGNLICDGTCGNPNSISGGTIIKASGAVTVNYVRLDNVTGTGGAVFTANNSVDLGFNTGWVINAPTPHSLYWIDDGGNWTDPDHWSFTSGGVASDCIPTFYDDVYVDINSFSGGGQFLNIDKLAYCKTMNWTGALDSSSFSGTKAIEIYGSLILNPDMNFIFTGPINFYGTTTGNTISSFGKTFLSPINFDAPGGEWNLQDNLNSTSSINLIEGSLITNNHSLTAFNFQSTSGGTRSLTLGSSILSFSWPGCCNGGWYVTGNGLTLNAGTSTINLTSPDGVFNSDSRTYYDVNFTSIYGTGVINYGNSSFHNVTFNGNAQIYNPEGTFNNVVINGTGTSTINGNNSFNNLTLGPSSITNFTDTMTINGILTCVGSCALPSTLNGGTISKSSGTVNIDYVRLQNNTATGGAVFTADHTSDLGNNSGWNINPPVASDLYWVGNDGIWNNPDHWSATSGGPSSGCIPTRYDNVFFDAASFGGSGQFVNISLPAFCKSMNWTGTMSSTSLIGTQGLNIFGSLTLYPGMNLTYSGPVTFRSNSIGNQLYFNGVMFPSSLTFDGLGGEWTMQDAFNSAYPLNLLKGTLKINANSTCKNLNLGLGAVLDVLSGFQLTVED